MTPDRLIAQALRFDNQVTSNVERILKALDDGGFEIVRKPEPSPKRPDPDPLERLYAWRTRNRIPATREMYCGD